MLVWPNEHFVVQQQHRISAYVKSLHVAAEQKTMNLGVTSVSLFETLLKHYNIRIF